MKELVSNIIHSDCLDKRVIAFTDSKNKYVNLRPAVKLTVELTDGRTYVIDVTDYFKGVIE